MNFPSQARHLPPLPASAREYPPGYKPGRTSLSGNPFSAWAPASPRGKGGLSQDYGAYRGAANNGEEMTASSMHSTTGDSAERRAGRVLRPIWGLEHTCRGHLRRLPRCADSRKDGTPAGRLRDSPTGGRLHRYDYGQRRICNERDYIRNTNPHERRIT